MSLFYRLPWLSPPEPRRRACVQGLTKSFSILLFSRPSGLNIETVHCTERSVELPEATVDVAFICDVYHHFEYPSDSMKSLFRAMKPGGELVLIDFVRIEGKSSDWVLGHVRAGQEVFEQEILSAGFEKVGEVTGVLKENYIVRFRKPSA